MYNFVMYCKTYSNDIHRFEQMINSFNKFNVDNIKLFVSIPATEKNLYDKFNDKNIIVVTDESYASNYLTEEKYHGLSSGYCNQEICKLSFWETKLAKNYLCIDSDTLFIRDFYIKDFMYDESTPFTVLVMDKDLAIEKYYHNFWLLRQEFIKKIYSEVGLEDRRYRTCHGMQVMNSKVLSSLKNDFMSQKGYLYVDLIKISPYEFTWYNAWFQKCEIIKEIAVEPFFKTFHMRIEYIFSRLRKLTLNDFAYSYVGIVLNSNWQKPIAIYENPKWWMIKLYKFLKKQ